MVGDNKETSGVTGKLELRFFLPCILLGFFKDKLLFTRVLRQEPDCPESVSPLETPAGGVGRGVPSRAEVRCGFLPQQLPGVRGGLILRD